MAGPNAFAEDEADARADSGNDPVPGDRVAPLGGRLHDGRRFQPNVQSTVTLSKALSRMTSS
jgi:hypothetical protein